MIQIDKYIGKFKTNTTLYFDFDSDYWDYYKPEGTYKEDYEMLRKGSILKAYELEDPEILGDGKIYSIELCSSTCASIFLPKLSDLYECEYLDEIEEGE